MTSKERAKELISKFMPHVRWKLSQDDCLDRAKECALVAVDELINNEYQLADKLLNIIHDNKIKLIASFPTQDYWQEVKQEINKL